MSLFFENLQLVVPGQKLSTADKFKPGLGVYREKVNESESMLFSALTGLASLRGNVVSIVPLEGRLYVPLEGDVVIGIVSSVGSRGWMVDIGGPYPAVLSASNVLDRNDPAMHSDLSRILKAKDLIFAMVSSYDRTRDPMLTMNERGLKKLVSGRLINVSPIKVPRIIGKQGSMISQIKESTKSQILVGQNGRVLINAPDFEAEQLVVETIRKIEEESHISGLTDRIKAFLTEHRKKT